MKYIKKNRDGSRVSPGYAAPFFLVLAVLTVVAFIIPLRPTRSYSEKRDLAAFPEFSTEALVSGSYFDDITVWFSDTFPGREGWMDLSGAISRLHGRADVLIQGDIQLGGDPVEVPVVPRPEDRTEPSEAPEQTETTAESVPPTTEPLQTEPEETIVLQEPPTESVEEWGGVDAGEDAEVYLSSSIVIGDTAFTYFGFSEYYSNEYIDIVNEFAEKMEGTGVNVINALAPTAVGIMVENEYMEKLRCAPQDQVIDYINGCLREGVVGVDTYEALVDHNDEYIFFRTDHHWTALAAYYVYEQLCLDMGYEPAALDSFEEWDLGEFRGSLFTKSTGSYLREDTVTAYKPQGEISMKIYNTDGSGFQSDVLVDVSKGNKNSKYMTFLAGDHALCVITNDSIPDAPNCVIVKDSFGNCFAPFLTQNYHKVYVLDYREYRAMGMTQFVEEYGIQDVILIPNLAASQTENVCKLLDYVLR